MVQNHMIIKGWVLGYATALEDECFLNFSLALHHACDQARKKLPKLFKLSEDTISNHTAKIIAEYNQ